MQNRIDNFFSPNLERNVVLLRRERRDVIYKRKYTMEQFIDEMRQPKEEREAFTKVDVIYKPVLNYYFGKQISNVVETHKMILFHHIRNEKISKVYYTNNIKGAHSRVVVQVGFKKVSFSYGQTGPRGFFNTQGRLTIDEFRDEPSESPGFREFKFCDLPTDCRLEDAIVLAKWIFDKGGFKIFNYWNVNCYMFSDALYFLLAGVEVFQKDKFHDELKEGITRIQNFRKLISEYGPCPFSNNLLYIN